MDILERMVLIFGLVLISAYSIKVSQDSVRSINEMNHQIQMMFIKS